MFSKYKKILNFASKPPLFMENIVILTVGSGIHPFSTVDKMADYLRRNAGSLNLSEGDIQELIDEKFLDTTVADFAYDTLKVDE